MFNFKKAFASITEFFTTESREFEYELPTLVEVKSVQKAAPTLMLKATKPTAVEPIAELVTVPTAMPIAEPVVTELVTELITEPVTELVEELVEESPISGAEKALEASLSRLARIEEQAKMAAQEVAILENIQGVNNLVKKAISDMEGQRLLPRDMQQRREAAAAENAEIDNLLSNLGF